METHKARAPQSWTFTAVFHTPWLCPLHLHLLRNLTAGPELHFSVDNYVEHLDILLCLFLNTFSVCLETLTLTSQVLLGPLQRPICFLLVYVDNQANVQGKTHLRQDLRHGKLKKKMCYGHLSLRGMAGKRMGQWGAGVTGRHSQVCFFITDTNQSITTIVFSLKCDWNLLLLIFKT